jgi:outer membrane protein OmpA-like peptidoglycan-associated protein
MTDSRTSILRALGLVLFTSFACATTQPSPMLVEARKDYDTARNGPPGKFVPDLVYEAKTMLDKAERAHARDPGSHEEEHLAYLAHRKTLLAIAAAEHRLALGDAAKAEKAFETVLMAQRNNANDKAANAGDQLDAERAKREKAEEAMRRAMASLAAIASVKAEANRTVITLSGEVLFKSKEATLLPGAQKQLDQVAEALKSQDDKKMVIEGHTDSQGKDDYNQGLSQRRADAVRTYLVGKGIPSDMIQAVGKGELEPIADNKSAEGRANNRRVEIEIDNGNP